jgi:hypothetical protein
MNHSVLLHGLSYEIVNDQLLRELFSFTLPSPTPSWLIFVSCSWGCCYHCGISNNLAHANLAGFMWGGNNTYWPKPLETWLLKHTSLGPEPWLPTPCVTSLPTMLSWTTELNFSLYDTQRNNENKEINLGINSGMSTTILTRVHYRTAKHE